MRQQGRSSHVVAPTPLALSQVYKTPTSSLRQTTFASTQNSTSSPSRVKPSEWNSPRTPLKQVRYDTRGPVELDASWHSRSSSEPSQNFRLEDALTVTTSPMPSSNPHVWTSTESSFFPRSEPLKRRTSRSNALSNDNGGFCDTTRTMYSQLSSMAQIRPRGPNREFGSAWRPTTLPRRGSDARDGVETFQMRVNDAPRSPASSTSNGRSDTIKRRLVEEYNYFKSRESERPTPAGYGNGVTPNYNELTSFSADRRDGQFQAGRNSRPRVKAATGKVVIPQRPVESTLTRSEYNDRIMDYRGGGDGGIGGYAPPSISAITSPTSMRGVYGSVGGSYSRSSGQPSPSSVIEELQGRFSAASRSREKRPALRPNPNTADLVVPAYHRKTATSMTTTATLVSKPHHQSDLTLPTTPVATLQSINATSTARIPSDASSNATLLRNTGNGAYRGGPSFRRLQTLYGTNISQKRYPSDNALDMTYLEDNFQPQNPSMPQFYISDRKAGTVKIQVRSRSEQGSPNNGITVHSPQQGLKFDDRIRSEQVIQPKALASAPRTVYSPPRNHTTSSSVDGPQAEDEENQVLPSVREIIRQVEEMTLKNSTANSSTSSLSRHQAIGSSQHISRSLVRPVNAEPQGSPNRSQSASAFRPANPNGVNIQANSYGDAFKGFSTTRRFDHESEGRSTGSQAPHVSRRTDQLTNLPQDYQKLLEAFLEQRKEIQRLRKEMVEKDRLIAALQKDIHMYEPWR